MIVRRCRAARRRGAVAVLVAICLVPLIGVLAFAIDGGLLLAARRRAQTVADASAHAAACQLYTNFLSDTTGLDVSGKARSAALTLASTNGCTNDGSTNTVSVNIPPQSGTFKNKPSYAEVIVTLKQPRMFSGVFGSGTISVTARGVARSTTGQPQPYSNASLIVLSSSNATNALLLSGGAVLNAESSVQDNSSNATALNVNGGSSLKASAVQITGNYSVTGGSTMNSTPVQTGVARLADPIASLSPPDPTTLPSQSFQSSWTSQTLSPGVYNNGITMANGGSNKMLPGVYYIKGGGLTISNGATLTASGVTIYMDAGAQLNVLGGTTVKLTPPTTGTYAGLSYFQNRTNTKSLNISNGASFTAAGTIYAPAGSATINGGTTSKYGSQLVLNTFSLSNGAQVTMPTKTDAASGYVATGASSPSITVVE